MDRGYTVIWLVALLTSVINVVYMLSYVNEAYFDATAAIPNARLVDDITVMRKSIAMITYWYMFGQPVYLLQVTKRAVKCNKFMILGVPMLVSILGHDDKLMEAYEDDMHFASFYVCVAGYFLHLAWRSEAGKQPSFLMFGCIVSMMPVSTTLKVCITHSNEYQLFSASIMRRVQYFVLYSTTWLEVFAILQALIDTPLQIDMWPEIYRMKPSSDVKNDIDSLNAKD